MSKVWVNKPLRFVLSASALFISLPAFATTYYVSTTGSDSNAGTSTTAPFKTIAHAAGLTNPGDTVNVMAGTYSVTGSPIINITRSGSASGGYITYQAYPGQQPLLQSSDAWQAINIQASYIVINGFEIEGMDEANITAAQAATLGESSPEANSAGIGVGSTSITTPWTHLVLSNNIIHGFSEGGIGVMRCDYVTIEKNITYDNAYWSPYGGSGISIFSSANSDTNTGYKNFVTGNISYGNQMLVGEPAAGGTMADGNGIIIDSNKGDQVGGAAYTGRTLVENNLTYMNGGTGMHTFDSQHVDFFFNTSYMNNQSADNSNGQIAAINSEDVLIENNVAYGTGTKPVAPTSGSEITENYNILYNGTTTGKGANDLVANPMFVTAGSNFQLQAGSPAIDSANSAYAVATDLSGNPRPVGAGYDRGAYEYQGPGGAAPSPSPIPSPSPSPAPKPTPSPTPTPTPSPSPSPKPVPSPTPSPSPSPKPVPSPTPSPSPSPKPIPSPSPVLAFGFSSGSVSQSSAKPGRTVEFTDTVKASAAASNVIIFTQLQNAEGKVVASSFVAGQAFTAGETRSFTSSYKIPVGLPAGIYYHTVEVFNATWSVNYMSHYDSSTLTIK
jgi:hypothetical protein